MEKCAAREVEFVNRLWAVSLCIFILSHWARAKTSGAIGSFPSHPDLPRPVESGEGGMSLVASGLRARPPPRASEGGKGVESGGDRRLIKSACSHPQREADLGSASLLCCSSYAALGHIEQLHSRSTARLR